MSDRNGMSAGPKNKTHAVPGGSPRFRRRLLCAMISGCLAPAGVAWASPQGGTIMAGEGNISQPNAATTVITQSSGALTIDWRSFNLSSGDDVRFVQPSTSSAVLNRVSNGQASSILGSIEANGRVFLINPAGIIFGAGARVNVGNLVASSLDIKTSDFMSGNYNFQSPIGSTGGPVVNEGVIQASTGGSVTMVGGSVVNSGLIAAHYGYINLGAGRQAVVDFGSDGLVGFAVNGKVISNAQGAPAAVSNTGTLEADGGRIILSGQAAADVFTEAVNNQGLLRAGRIENQGGQIVLTASGAGVVNTGTLDASASTTGQNGGSVLMAGPVVNQDGVVRADAANGQGGSVTLQAGNLAQLGGNSMTSARAISGGQGGTVTILGDRVGLLNQGSVDVSGAQGGGIVRIGGDAGGKGSLPNANYAYMSPYSSIYANAIDSGNGGHVVFWADKATRAYGSISARGGSVGGDGGLIETSGYYLDVNGLRVDTSAPGGLSGAWLLDPYDITITNATNNVSTSGTNTIAYTPDGTASTLDASTIASVLSGGSSVIVETTGATSAPGTSNGNINVDASIQPSSLSKNVTLTLDAAGQITIGTTATAVAIGSTAIQNSFTVDLSAGGSISEAGTSAITATALSTTSVGGTTLTGTNQVGTLAATDNSSTSGSGIAFDDGQALTLSGISETGSNASVSNTGGSLTVSGSVGAGTGTVTLDSSGAISGTGVITATTLNLQTLSGDTAAVGTTSAPLNVNAGSGTMTVNAGASGSGVSGLNLDQTSSSGTLALGTVFLGTNAPLTAESTGGLALASTGYNTGTAALTLSSGTNLSLGSTPLTGGIVTLTSSGAISGTGVITATALSTTSVGGTTLTDPNNQIRTFGSSDTSSAGIQLNNTGLLDLAKIGESGGGGLTVNNTGPIVVQGVLKTGSGGSVNLAASGGSGSLSESGGSIVTGNLTTSSGAGTSLNGPNSVFALNALDSSTNGITFSDTGATGIGSMTETGSGGISVTSAAGINMSTGSTVQTTGGAIDLVAQTGDIYLGLLKANGGPVELTASAGSIFNSGGLGEVNVSGASATLHSAAYIGKSVSQPVVFDVPGDINLISTAPITYIYNSDKGTVTTTSPIYDLSSAIDEAGARGQAAGLTENSVTDWSAFTPGLTLFGVTDPGVLLPPGQSNQS